MVATWRHLDCPRHLKCPRRRQECIVVNRAPGCNQFVVRMSPTGNQFWTLLTPWNHRTLGFHPYVPLFAVHGFVESNWAEDAAFEAIGEGDEGTDRLEKREGEELDESASIQVDCGKMVEFVLNVKQAQRA